MKTKNQVKIEMLNKLLADYQMYYQNLRGLHWNVKGSMFFMLHEKYEEYYNEASAVVDEIAERILMVGGQPLHTFGDYIKTASLKEVSGVSNGKAGVEIVLENSRYLLNGLKELLTVANKTGDEGTAAFIGELVGSTEKRIWMLSSWLSE